MTRGLLASIAATLVGAGLAVSTPGTRLVIRLVNDGSMPHNLVLVRSEGSINPVGMAALEAADTEYIAGHTDPTRDDLRRVLFSDVTVPRP